MADETLPPSDATGGEALHAACEAQTGALEVKYKRALADLANREKEFARERAEFAKYAAASVIRDILPIVDAVEAGIQSSPSPQSGEGELEGERQPGTSDVGALAKLLHNLLTHHGVARIPCDGKPDYTLHEIVGTRAMEGAELGTIIEVVQQGYTMHGQCLRPAKVIVCAENQHDASTRTRSS